MQKNQKTTKKQRRLTPAQKYFNDEFLRAVKSRQSSCIWTQGDWRDWWEMQEKMAIMWFGDLKNQEYYSADVKSPEIAGRIDSVMQKLAKLNIRFVVRPKRAEVAGFAKIYEEIINYTFNSGRFRYRLRDAFWDALVHGTAALTVDFIVRKRKVKMPVTNPDEMTAKEKRLLKEKGKIPYRIVEVFDRFNVALVNRQLSEIFIDPSARNIDDDVYYAGYYFRVTRMPYKRFKKTYKNRIGFINISRVKPIKKLDNDVFDSDLFFARIDADEDGDYVFLIEMFDYDNDRYMAKANDVFITPDDLPLPYAHKKLNLVLLHPKKLPNSIYGIGLVDALLPIVEQIEQLQNAIYDYVMYTTNPILMVEKNIYGDFSQKYQKAEPGLMIPVMDVGRSVAPLKFPALSVDVFQALQNLKRDAVIATQQDPSQLGVVVKNATATANLINKEITEAYINYVINNFIDSLNDIAKQVFWLHKQYLSKGIVRQMIGDKEPEAVRYTIPVEGKRYVIDWEQYKISKIEYDPNVTGYIELKPDIFFYKDNNGQLQQIHPDDFDIEVSPESVEIISRALEAQKTKEMVQMLAPFMVDPDDEEMVMQNPRGWVDGPSLLRDMLEKSGMPTKYIIKKKEKIQESVARAREQNKLMLQGIEAVSIPGEGRAHIIEHERLLIELIQKRNETNARLKQLLEDENIAMLVANGQVPQEVSNLQDKLETQQKVIDILTKHIELDSKNAAMHIDVFKTEAAPKGGNKEQSPGMQIDLSKGSQLNNAFMNTGLPGQPNLMRMYGTSQGGQGMIGGLASVTE